MTSIHPVAVVTGAGRLRGIGYATARLLSRDGYLVVIAERPGSQPTADERSKGWRGAASAVEAIAADGGRAAAVQCDVTDPESVNQLVEAACRLGDLAVLVNNAGTAGEASSYRLHEVAGDLWSKTIDINMTSLYLTAVAAVPALSASTAKNKAIVNLSSLAGLRPLPYYGGYSATKAAVMAMTQQMAVELARYGIRVNCVSPGSTDTDMIAGTMDRAETRAGMAAGSVRDISVRRIPLRRFADPVEVAEAICFFAGERASYITGQTLQVDGGLSLV